MSNSPSFEDGAVMGFFTASTRNLLEAEEEVGVRHHVVLSVVGTGRGLPDNGYLRAKGAQEDLVAASGVPYTIVRATQFFEFLGGIADAAEGKDGVVRVPPVAFQPIAADDVAAVVAEAALGPPVNGDVEIAGPERFRFDEVVRKALRARDDRREVVADPEARYFGSRLQERSLVPEGRPELGGVTLAEWLESERQPTNPLRNSRKDSEGKARTMTKHVLEPAAQELADATSKPPFLYEVGPEKARKVLDDIQAAPFEKLPVEEKWVTVPTAVGDVRVRLIKPFGLGGSLPVLLYVHGGGWVLGNAGTHDRLVRELAVGAHCAVAFPEYDRSPEAQYPTAIEQSYATARWLIEHGQEEGIDASRMAIAGDSVGGDMTAVIAILAKDRGDVTFVHQSLYYPVTDAAQNTDSYREFADGPFLTAKAMAWFWDCYCPDKALRDEITVSPLRASVEQLAGLPPTLVIVDENDVLRDEGEAYARKLTEAGVPVTCVRFNGILHDFMMLNPVRSTNAASAAITLATDALRHALGTQKGVL
ncbi:alpha/beta hydrolase fold domain-containing protein [Actinocorallia sp. API 0066]|nr:alpha/beta hydrolase fold domain-containing protein [Actinocorallia sp. API 0066]MCD0451937.1 alpha/beta hydrolase fold domain-containing protein [Actinocorallia sp. API 0066]